MERFQIILAAFIVVVLSIPVTAGAQGFPVGNNYPSAGVLPLPHFGSLCKSDRGACSRFWGNPTLYIGWIEHPHGNKWTATYHFPAIVNKEKDGWPLYGIWLEASEEIRLTSDYGLIFSGGVLFPQDSEGTMSYYGELKFDVKSYERWQVEGLAKVPASGPIEILSGFRYMNIDYKLSFRDKTTEDDCIHAYLPLVGAQMNPEFSKGALLVRLLVAPRVYGDMRYHYWALDGLSGYSERADYNLIDSFLVEILARYDRKIGISGSAVGAFVKWDHLKIYTGDKAYSASSPESSISLEGDIRSWTFGGSLTWAF